MSNTEASRIMVDGFLVRLAVQQWGHRAQVMTALEEMGELTTILARSLRGTRQVDITDIREEIADVMNMVEQLRIMYGPEAVDKLRQEKLQRTLDKLKP